MRARNLIAPLAVLALTGCGISSPLTPPATGGAQNNPAPPQNQPGQPAPSPVAPTELPILGKRTTADRDVPLEVAVRQVSSGTGAMTVTFSVTNRSTSGTTWWANSFFDDGVNQYPQDNRWTVDGMAVIDTTNAKRYLPARTADHQCMCSANTSTSISPDQTIYLSATYQAVPAEVTKVSVDIPHAGVFADVPVTR